MPLHLVRNDVTAMAVDAVVNPTNPSLEPGGGLDALIHRKAGRALTDACRTVGHIEPGEAAATPGFGLGCRYVFHTAGPVWQDGTAGEETILRACYRSCMRLARARGCASVAFPLIGTGALGCPKDKVLGIAYNELLSCLSDYEADVYLVVYDKTSYSIGEALYGSVRSYIDDLTPHVPENAVCDAASVKTARKRLSRRETIGGAARHKPSMYAAAPIQHFKEEALCEERAECECLADTAADKSLEDLLRHMDAGFSLRLQLLIDRKGMSDVDCYKRANVSKQTWYKILNDPDYRPSKTTVLCFAVALHLSLTETQTLLATAGYALSHSSKADIIIEYFLSRGIYDFAEIDGTLLQFDQQTLGAYA